MAFVDYESLKGKVWCLVESRGDYHVLPDLDLIEHETDEDCICGVRTELVSGTNGDLWMYTHEALDGRE